VTLDVTKRNHKLNNVAKDMQLAIKEFSSTKREHSVIYFDEMQM
jgi:hypothetical protein